MKTSTEAEIMQLKAINAALLGRKRQKAKDELNATLKKEMELARAKNRKRVEDAYAHCEEGGRRCGM